MSEGRSVFDLAGPVAGCALGAAGVVAAQLSAVEDVGVWVVPGAMACCLLCALLQLKNKIQS